MDTIQCYKPYSLVESRASEKLLLIIINTKLCLLFFREEVRTNVLTKGKPHFYIPTGYFEWTHLYSLKIC